MDGESGASGRGVRWKEVAWLWPLSVSDGQLLEIVRLKRSGGEADGAAGD